MGMPASRGVAAMMLMGSAEALMPGAMPHQGVATAGRARSVQMAGAVALAKKTTTVEKIRENMADASLMFCIRSEGIEPNDLNNFRQQLPEEIKLQCVKNTLIKVACRPSEDGSFEGIERFNCADTDKMDDLLQYSNYWFFVPEESMRDGVKLFNSWVDDNKLKDKDGEGVEAISKLPTKQELMQQTAIALKMVPTKLARSLKQAGAERLAKGLKQASAQKMVVAVKLASDKMPN